MDVNFLAFVTAATHALPALEKSNGSIIVMNALFGLSHSAVFSGNEQFPVYASFRFSKLSVSSRITIVFL